MNTLTSGTSPLSHAPTWQARIPDLSVLSHTGETLQFYSDLVKGKRVLVNFMAITSHADNPVSTNLREVARAAGPALGGPLRMLSLTFDPANDSPERLARFAETLGAPPEWLFLTGDKPTLDALRDAFFRHGARAPGPEEEDRRAAFERLWGGLVDDPRALFCDQPSSLQDCSAGLVRYGNDALGIWGSVPARARPEAILERLSWLEPKPPREVDAPLRRGGPWPVVVS